MKKLPIPIYDDDKIITDLADNHRLHNTTYPHLRNQIGVITGLYTQYVNKNGDAWSIVPAPITPALKQGLIKNYGSPPALLGFIKEIRDSSPDVCPMCGAEKTGTLDHILPKEDYSQWAVFSKNLVPACDCNIKRGQALKGDAVKHERILHPYFDDCLQQRQLTCLIESIDNFRIVDISIIYINPLEPQIDSIKFHVNKIIEPVGIMKWLEHKWIKLRKSPINQIHTIPKRIINTRVELASFLQDALDRHDASKGTPNNWQSIFLHGVLNSPGVVQWLLARHNGIMNGTIDPLSD